MDMMQTQPQQPPQGGFFSQNSAEGYNGYNPDEENTGFTVNSDEIENGIKEQLDEQQDKNLDRVVKAGNELLFGEETHYQLMDQLQNSKDIGADLGAGAFSAMSILYKESGNSIPGDVILPAGVILLARASEFLNESGMAQITDDDFEKATHLFSVKMMDAYDPDFNNRMQQAIGQQPQPDQPQPDQSQQNNGLLGGV